MALEKPPGWGEMVLLPSWGGTGLWSQQHCSATSRVSPGSRDAEDRKEGSAALQEGRFSEMRDLLRGFCVFSPANAAPRSNLGRELPM